MKGTEGSGSPPPPSSRSPSSSSSSSSDGRRSRSRSWSPIASSSFRRPIALQPSSPEEAEAAAVGEESKALYLFFSYISGPIDYCLHAIKLPNPILPPHPLQPCDKFRETENTIYPVLEFPSGEYPSSMCCVELESKLYFLGGQFLSSLEGLSLKEEDRNRIGDCPPEVYVLDTATISANTTATTDATTEPSELLTKGTAMNTGKPNPYVFVAHRKIYAIGTIPRFKSKLMDRSRFEVFDPDSGKWSTLPDPPMNVILTGHALADRNVFVITMDNQVFSFNVDKCEWVERAFTGNTFYSIYYDSLTAFGPTSSMSEFECEYESKSKRFFDHMALQLNEDNTVKDHVPRIYPLYFPVHLGNRICCYVLAGGLPHPEHPDHIYLADPEKSHISIITFEVPREIYTESGSESDKTFSNANWLRLARFDARSKCGAIASSSILEGCFSISTGGTMESMQD